MKYNLKENPLRLQDIHLRNGDEITVSWKKKIKCKCGKECWLAVKNMKVILIELVGLAEWDRHLCLIKTP